MTQLKKFLPPIIITLCLACVYLRTIAPGLSWAFDGADGGDLVTAAASGGVPHPTGYPTYLLIAGLFLKIPVGSLAYRTNLLSVICTLATVLTIYKIVRSLEQTIFSAAVASLTFGTFQLVWSQAIITEVYALDALFAALLFHFFINRSVYRWSDYVWGIAAGLGLGNHLVILFMLPLMFVDIFLPTQGSSAEAAGKQPNDSKIRIVVRRLAGLCLGLSIYFLIPGRAGAEAPVNWGNATRWDGLIWLATGKLYWGRLNEINGNYLIAGIRAWSHFLLGQLGVYGLLVVFIVLAVLFKRSRFYLASGWMVLAYSTFSILYSSPDSYVYLMPAMIAISIWMGLGSGWLVERIPARFRYIKPAAEIGIFAFILINAILAIPKMDLSADHTVDRYAQAILNSAPSKAVIFTQGDESTFALWYFHYAYHQRPDIAIVSSDLMTQPWYKTVLHYTYPDLVIKDDSQEEDIMRDNPMRSMCQLAPDLQAEVICSFQ